MLRAAISAAEHWPFGRVQRFVRERSLRSALVLAPILGAALMMGSASSAVAQQTATVRFEVGEYRPEYPPAELVSFDNPQQASAVHHLVTASIDPSRNRLTASDRVTIVHPRGISAALPFSFLLWKDLDVLEVEAVADSQSTSAPGNSIRVVAQERERLQVRSLWEQPPYDELEGYELARQVDLALQGAETWPETLAVVVHYEGAVLDSLHPPRVAYARSFDTTAGLIVAEGAYLAGSTFWIPSRPGDVFTFELRVEVPTSWRTVSQGRMAVARPQGDRHFSRWICPHPMEEIYLVAGPWEEHHLRHGDVFAQTFTYADTDSSIYNRYLRGTGRYLDLYEEQIGAYPFAKFALVENFWQTGFGMPSFTLLGNRVIRLPFILDTSYGHEILHNWWGNGVFVKADEGNWCEGLTTYGADYAYKERESPSAAREYRLNALQSYLDYVSESEDLPLGRFRERHDFATQAVGYSKSMMVFHQVRRALGDAAFRSGLQQFYRDFLWRRASWSDLFECFAAQLSRSAGQRSVWAHQQLEQWIERPGAPTLRLKSATREKVGPGWSVEIWISQDVAPGGSPFSVQVPVRVVGPGGETIDQVMELQGAEHGLSVSCSFEPVRVEIDPDFDVLRRLHREEIPASLSQVLGADSVMIVIAAGQSEEMTRALRELAEIWAKDQSASVVMESDLPAGLVLGETEPLSRTRPEPQKSSLAIWFLGVGPAAEREIAKQSELTRDHGDWGMAGSTFPATSSFVVAGALHDGSAWGAVIPADPGIVASIGRKVPHYGKYSYLVFEGDTNVGKGVWKAGASPLARDLES